MTPNFYDYGFSGLLSGIDPKKFFWIVQTLMDKCEQLHGAKLTGMVSIFSGFF
jgi:hypothetical protein